MSGGPGVAGICPLPCVNSRRPPECRPRSAAPFALFVRSFFYCQILQTNVSCSQFPTIERSIHRKEIARRPYFSRRAGSRPFGSRSIETDLAKQHNSRREPMFNTHFKNFFLGLLFVASAQAATNVLNFNTDPKLTGLYSLHGNVQDVNGVDASWRPNGGATGGANDGYLAVTDARGGSQSVLVFKDLEAGLIVKSFTFECDLRIGGGRGGTTEPADGFSINYASTDDPLVLASDA